MPQIEKKYYTIGAITKVCTLLEKLSEKKGWHLAELCKAMSMPKTTIHRMLLTLEDEGFVRQEQRGGQYCLTYKLFSLGKKVLTDTNLVDIFKPVAIRIREELDETVNLCVGSGLDMIILDKASTTQALRSENFVGSMFPMFYSASGKAFLAFQPEAQCMAILEKICELTTPPISDRTLSIFLKELEETRTTGFAYDNEELFPGVRCIAVPLFDSRNESIGSVSISAPTVRLTRKNIDRIEHALKLGGKEISRQLGTTHPLYS